MATSDVTSTPSPGAAGPSLLAHHWFLLILIVLSAVGVYVTDSFPSYGHTYWIGMGGLFGAFNLYTGWARNRQSGVTVPDILRTMLLHWAGFLAAVYVIFLIYRAGNMDANTTGMVTLLALALTTYLAGVHFDWRLCFIGALLASVVGGGALLQRFLWMALLPIGVAAVLGLYLWMRREPAVAGSEVASDK